MFDITVHFEPFTDGIPGSTQGRICCLLAKDEAESDEDIALWNKGWHFLKKPSEQE